jgi:hypothetical protein
MPAITALSGPGQAKDKILFKYRSLMLAGVFVLSGFVLLVFAYSTDKDHSTHPRPFLSFIALQVGALLIFGAGYSALSDYLLKGNFERLVLSGVDRVRLDQTIKEFGLTEVLSKFSPEHLDTMIRQSSNVQMLVLRSNSFFGSHYQELISRLNAGDLTLTIALPDPRNYELMSLMSAKFTDDNTPEKLSQSILDVIDVWLKGKIYQGLNQGARDRLKVLLVQKYPLYSAYRFDRKELWYIPYHHRNDHQQLAVFVFRRDFQTTEVYKDLSALLDESTNHDLSSDITLPHEFYGDR